MILPEIGERFDGRYDVESVLGEGGFARVYGARDRSNGQVVALKVLTPEADGYDQQTRARFAREVRILAGLNDRRTVQLLASGESPTGVLYLVFEHVPGEDLRAVLRARRTLPPDDVAHILRQLMQSLAEAHAAGMLHRDIKPDNVRLFTSAEGPLTLKLLDFGIARATDDGSATITKAGELLGTPRYMSPEQLRGDPLTAASDIYSAGMMGLEALYGSDVLAGNRWTDQIDRMRTGHVFGIPGADNPDHPLLRVLQRMTARDPAARYPSAESVTIALDGKRPGTAVVLTAAEPPPGRGPLVIGVGVLLVIVAAIGAMMALPEEPPVRQIVLQQEPVTGHSLVRSAAAPDIAPVPVPVPVPDAAPDTDRCQPFTGFGRLNASEFDGHDWPTYIPPRTTDRPRPLVVLIHGLGQGGGPFLAESGFAAVADEGDFVVIAPEESVIVGWTGLPENVERMREFVGATVAQLCLDSRRIFIVGQGHGGLAADLSCVDWVTGVATHAFPRHIEGNACHDQPKPFLLASPKFSKHEPFEGGRSTIGRLQLPVLDVEADRRTVNGCHAARTTTFSNAEGSCYSWDCDVPFAACHINGGHTWPGTASRLGFDLLKGDGPGSNFPLAQQVWAFFKTVPPLPAMAAQ